MKPKVFDVHQAAEDEPAAFADEAQHFHEAAADRVEHVLAARHQQHQRGEGDLQADAGGDQLPVDGLLLFETSHAMPISTARPNRPKATRAMASTESPVP